MKQRTIYFLIGTTAELIKLVPVIREFQRRKIPFSIIATGQNDIHFEEFATELRSLNISYAVAPKGKDPSLLLFFFWCIKTFLSLLIGLRYWHGRLNKSNSYFIVHGDTVSSFIGSLVARFYGLTLVHIESGLRSYDFFEPFPEEICRYFISRLADIHFCPNQWALQNLSKVGGEKVNTGQNTLIETYQTVMEKKCEHPLLMYLKKNKTKYFILVTHRQEHVLFGRKKTAETLKYILDIVPENIQCIFLVHDLSSEFVSAFGKKLSQSIANRIIRVERLSYGDFLHLIKGSEFMITDGGSNQEEMYYMGKPCLLLRGRTERTEGLGDNIILSKSKHSIIRHFIKNYNSYRKNSIKSKVIPSKIISDYLFG